MNLALFLANFLTAHLRAVETPKTKDVLLNAHLYLVKVSQVEDREIFKICLEYWIKLVSELYDEIQSLPIGESGLLMGLSLGGGPASSVLNGVPLRKNIYTDVLSNLRLVVIERMVKPEEVRESKGCPSFSVKVSPRFLSSKMTRAKLFVNL
jgi:exportin-1